MAAEDADATLSELGEFAVIDRLVADRRQPPAVSLGPGDDAAVVFAADGRTVVCTDMLVEGRHFRLDWSTPHDIGRKAIAQNAADIEAMGARATAFVAAFGAPGDTPTAAAVQVADGMWHEAALLGAGIVGGDTVAAPQWVISVAALGDLGGREPVRRDGARPGDTVAVTGVLGRSAAGYELLRNGIDGFDELRRQHRVPSPPYGQGAIAAQAGATAMTDVSDGLLADLAHIASASGVSIDITLDTLTADVAAVADAAGATGVDARQWVLGGGEDHALVATFPGAVPPNWRVLGTVAATAADGAPAVTVDGSPWIGNAGWQSF
ncbi:thiamine-phosphate kinase [Mycolicibacterium gilvum]|uniref:Thiamine-monophosphate kinase n=1 Tax=Mycolicibacterium gilvum TaxID=1804 RepID=A0A378SKY2_9MYCO|nr:thiamine-phosphate kinase [Mycolicibacterium gilvum]MCV7054229.1 thiamine-phosphate kinase [Mycolicibacterium gilvum]STZ42818.1 thiamine monophosphate kinase [Mycolicibacterium gilvum]